MTMNKILIFLSCVIFLVCLPAAASAQDGGNSSIGGAEAICGTDAECQRTLAQCRADLQTQTATAASLIEQFQKCANDLRTRTTPPPKSTATPPRNVCAPDTYCRIEGIKPICGTNQDGSGDVNPQRVAVLKSGLNMFSCPLLDSPDYREALAKLARDIAALKNRLDAMDKEVPGWRETRQKTEHLFELIGQPDIFAKNWQDLLEWARQTERRLGAIENFLNYMLPLVIETRDTVCPPIPDKPNATFRERCEAEMAKHGGSKVSVEVGVRGGADFRPGIGPTPVVGPVVRMVIAVPGSDIALIGEAMVGGTGNSSTGTQILGRGAAGVRVYTDKSHQTSVDIKAYGQGVRSVHSAGYQNDTLHESAMGAGAGGELGLNHCFTKDSSFCISAGGSLGYGRYNNFPGPYQIDRQGGVEGGVFGELKYHVKLH